MEGHHQEALSERRGFNAKMRWKWSERCASLDSWDLQEVMCVGGSSGSYKLAVWVRNMLMKI